MFVNKKRVYFIDLFSGNLSRFYFNRNNYQFSLVGGILGFTGVLVYKILRYKLPSEKYIDAVVLSFLFAGIVVYIGAFFGWQVFGKPTTLPIGIAYTSAESVNSYTSPVVPLALIYAFVCFVLFCALYIMRMSFIKKEWFVGYMGIALFSMLLLLLEFLSSDVDSVQSVIYLNLNQVFSLLLLGYSVQWLKKIFTSVE